MASKKIVLNAAGDAATVAPATLGDVFTTMFSSNESVTGGYKYLQLGIAGAIGGAIDRRVTTGAFGIPFMPLK